MITKPSLMVRFFLPLLLIMGSCLQAQEELSELQDPWQIGLVYSLDELRPLSTFTVDHFHWIDYTEDQTNLSIGMSIMRKVHPMWSLRSGLVYSQRDVSGVYSCDFCDPTGEVFALPIRYLSIPVLIRYQIPLHKFSVYAETGVSTAFFLGISKRNPPIIGSKAPGSAMIESISGLGLTFRISDRISTMLGYQYTQTLTHLDRSYGFDWKFRFHGIQAGISSRLGK